MLSTIPIRIFFLYYFLLFYSCYSMKRRTLYSAITPFLPQLRLHHLVLITTTKNDKAYTIDFSPIPMNGSFTLTQLHLLFANNVPGEVRVRRIEDYSNKTDDEIINDWNTVNTIYSNVDESQKLSNQVMESIDDNGIITILNTLKQWSTTMNLYTHNCQHFSKYVSDLRIDF